MTRLAIPLRILLPGAVAVFALGLLTVMLWAQLRTVRDQQLARAADDLRAAAAELRNDLDRAARRGDQIGLADAVVWSGIHPCAAGTALIGPDGQVIAATRAEWSGRPAAEVLPDWLAAFTGLAPPGGQVEAVGASDRIVAAFPVDLDGTGRADAAGVLLVAHDGSRTVAGARVAVWDRFRVLSAVALAVAVFLGVALNALISRRVSRLLASVERIGAGDLTVRPDVSGGDEIGRLAAGLGTMADRLATTSAERAQAEEQLRRTAELLQAVADGVPDAIFVKDRQGRYLMFNAAASRFVGKPVAEVLGRDDTAVFESDSARHIMARDCRVMESEAAEEEEETVTAAGVTRTYLARKAPYRDAAGTVVGLIGISTDITERKRMEQALRDSEERFRAFADHSADALFIQGPGGVVVDVNAQACASLGYTREELIGKSPWDFDPDLTPPMAADIGRRLDAGETVAVDSRHRRKDGTVFPVEIRMRPFRTAAGLMGLSAVRDVTDRVRAEAALREQDELLGKLTERVPGVLYQFRLWPDGRSCLPYASRGIRDVFEATPEEVRESAAVVLSRVHPDDLARVDAGIRASAETLGDWRCEYRVVLPSGGVRWLEGHSVPERLPDGSTLWHGYIRDVTARRQVDDALRESEERLRIFIDHVPAGVVMLDRDLRYLACSRRWRIDYGLGDRDLTGLGHYEVFPDIPDRWKEIHRRCLAGATERCEQDRFDRPDGSTIYLRWEVQPWRDAGGGIGGLVFFTEVVTDRVQAEEALRESEEKLRTIVDNEPECVKLLDRKGFVLEMNPAGLGMVEASTIEDVRGAAVGCLVADGDRAAFDDMLAAVFRGESRRLTFEMRGLAGTRRVLETHSVPLWSADRREVRALLGVTRDVTERVRAEQALRESEERFRTFLDNAPILAWVNDETGATSFVNAAWRRAFGRAGEAIRGRSMVDTLAEQPVADYLASDRQVIATGTPLQVEETGPGAGGGEGRYLVTKFPFGNSPDGRRLVGGVAVEITERVRAEQAVRESEERFRLASEAFQGLLYDLDLTTGAVYRSAGVRDLLGYSPEELAADKDRWVELLHPDDRARVLAAVGAALSTGTRVDLEYRLRHRDGRYVDVWDRGQIVRAADGTPVRIVGSTLDQTDRKQAERRLQKMSFCVERAGESIFWIAPDGRITYVNDAACAGRGYTRDELLGMRIFDLDPDYQPGVWDSHFDDLRRRGSVALETRHRARDGRVFPVEVGANYVRFGEEEFNFAFARDITARRRAEEEIRALNADLERRVADRTAELSRLVAVLDASPDFISICEDPMRPAIYDNAAMQRLGATRGLRPDELNLRTFHPPDSVRLLTEVALPVVLRDGIWVGETEVIGGDGRAIPVSQVLQTHKDADGRVRYLSTIMRNISDLKRLENELRQSRDSLLRVNAELSKASRLKDEFLASMSHELRTPLNGVLALSESLQEGVYGPVSPPQAAALRDIEQSGRHLLTLINDILDLSKVEAGQIALEPGPVEVDALCQGALRLVREMAQKKRHRLTTSVDGAVGLIVADAKRLKQVLVNLLSNAVKFTPDGGAVGLEVTADHNRQSVSFAVWDTGIGIRAEDFGLLFQPFRQIDSRLSREFAGTGLGLALVRRLVELHGGGVEVTSTPGQGSRFTVTIPWLVPAPTDHEPAPANTPVRKVLVVEDSPDDARKMDRYLTALNVEVVIHAGAVGAVDRVRAERPDLVLLDLLLPDGDGWQVLSALKASADIGATPVVVLSVVDDRPRCLGLGAAEVLIKPIDRDTLRTTLQRVINPLVGRRAVAILPPAPGPTAPLILLAEDNPVNARTVGDYLRAIGYRVEVVEDGLRAVEVAIALRPSLILMDVQMPRVDGLAATRRLRALDATAGTPVVALTALAMPGDRERCLEVGADEYLTKPVSLRQLREVIERLLGSPPPSDPQPDQSAAT